MKRLAVCILMLLATCSGCASRRTAVAETKQAFAAEQEAAREKVESRGRYDVEHKTYDTMSINSMGSD